MVVIQSASDSYSNQIITSVVVSSTKRTEPIYYNNDYYPFYPYIREKDIGINTSNLFVDSARISNLYLKGMGGDFDGDTISSKGVFIEESNEELEEFVNSKQNFIDFAGNPLRYPGDDSIQAIYSLTRVLSDTKLTSNIEF